MAWKNYSIEVFNDIKDEQKRFKIVKAFLDFYKNNKKLRIVDKSFLKYNLTELIESGKVYISEAALAKFIKNGITNIGDIDLTNIHTEPHQLRYTKYLNAKKELSFIWEHVVPVEVLLNLLIKENKNGTLNLSKFQKISQMAHVCIVTEQQNGDLNKYKDRMPKGWDKKKTYNPWARYDDLNIIVHGRKYAKF